MKTAPSKPNRIVAYLRFSAGAAFFAAAAALAFVAATTNVMTAHDVAASKPRLPVSKASIQDSLFGAASEYSEQDGSLGNPDPASQEQALIRAYPAASTPFTAQLNSITSFRRFMANSASNAQTGTTGKTGRVSAKNKKGPPEPPRFNTWQMIGPSTSSFPSVLTFSGAAYNTSGRITALEIDRVNGCSAAFCRVWVGAAGGGVWRTTNALAVTPTWTFLGQIGVPTNAIGAITYDGAANILYVGTGEGNASADSEAGLGIYTSMNGGDSWTWLPSSIGPITTFSAGVPNGTYQGNAFFGRAITRITVDPVNHATIYVSSTRAVRGVDSTGAGATTNPPTPRPPYGLFKSTTGGYTFTYIWDGSATCPGICDGSDVASSIRGVTDVKLDPGNHNIVYATVFPGSGAGGGVWRSLDGGTTWFQIHASINPGDNVSRAAFDVTLFGGDTMMYIAEGNDGANTAHVFRTFAAETGFPPAFTDLTAAESPMGQTAGYCTGQCWYDNNVVIPQDDPFANIVYIQGSFSYATYGGSTNGRAVLATQFATDPTPANVTWFDFTWDSTNNNTGGGSCCNPNAAGDGIFPNGMHPDQHALVTIPGIPTFFFAGSDGGLVGSHSGYTDISGQCVARIFVTIFTVPDLVLCEQLLSAVPTFMSNLNAGLKTLQFQSLDYASFNQFNVQGGTQDNGTFQTFGSMTWNQMIYGDGGQNGISTVNNTHRFNTFTGNAHDTNYRSGNPVFWTVASGPIFVAEGALFYPPIIRDPTFNETIFEGSRHVWRTQDWAGGQAFQETNCPEFTTSAANPACGDFVPLGGPAGANTPGALGGTFYGGDRRPTATTQRVEAIARTTSNTNVAWASTVGGRVFISQNVDGAAAGVTWTRLDQDSGAAPGSPGGTSADPTRVPTGIAIDPANNFHAWISYSGYNFNTPNQPGHIFSVTWGGAGMSNAVWTNISNNLPDIPFTSIVVDPNTGDLYVSCDFTVFRLKANQQLGQTVWDVAGIGLPIVEVPKLTINPGARVLYAATHGLSAWKLPLY